MPEKLVNDIIGYIGEYYCYILYAIYIYMLYAILVNVIIGYMLYW